MSEMSLHGEWLSLMDISGPFLAEPVLKDAFPQGLEEVEPGKRKLLRQAYDEWRDALELGDDDLSALHAAWIDLVLRQGLELDEDGDGDILKSGDDLPDNLTHKFAEHSVTLRPDYAVVDDQKANASLMLISVYQPETDLNEPLKGDGWAASPAERMVELCRAKETRLGLVTNGEHWMLVDAPVGAVTTFASWYARLWSPEPKTLQSFINLLGVRRFFVGNDEQLPALFDASLKMQDEVTDALGEQVRRAVEVLIQALDRADVDRNRELLKGIEPTDLYEAGLTVMMRIVFLLSAEERGLLLLGDERYEANYAVSTLRMQLRAESEEILERRFDAWARLLAIFRAVYGGIEHEEMRLPALGGSLFDPNRFPFLEGRLKGSDWRTDHAVPLPIDNRTVLLLLDAVQLFQGRTLSYRALDVEQIGYVYEGLLERTVARAKEVTLDLDATKSAKKPWVTLEELEAAADSGEDAVSNLLKERTGSSASRVKNDISKMVETVDADKLLTACHADVALRDRIKPYFHFLRIDRWGYPLVYPVGTFMVTTGSDRSESGTHYTPKSLTEAVVKETLEPIVFIGPSDGKPRDEWILKSPAELLDLKVCDPAMGSGAFLVQVCRYLSDRLVEAWSKAEKDGSAVTAQGDVVERQNGHEPLRNDLEERLLTARRLIAERCLYGVDINQLAVELAKLSIWLITLAKGRPFGFLDHNLRAGDSLLGIHDLDQLLYLEMNPGRGSSKKLFAREIDKSVAEAVALRAQIRSRPIVDIHDVEAIAELDERARRKLELPELISDALVGEALAEGGKPIDTTSLSIEAGRAVAGNSDAVGQMRKRAVEGLCVDLSAAKNARMPFHWPLEFPEIFARGTHGFDAIVGNPPFLGGKKIAGAMGRKYLNYLISRVGEGTKGSADLIAFFFLRSVSLISNQRTFGLIASNSISEGGTREVGLEKIRSQGNTIYHAVPSQIWPGSASVVTSQVHVFKGNWHGRVRLNDRDVKTISAYLSDRVNWEPVKLSENKGRVQQGSVPLGKGFIIEERTAKEWLENRPILERVLFPYLSGQDVNRRPKHIPERWVINFWDWSAELAKTFSPELFQFLEERVRPERLEMKSMGGSADTFWRHLWYRSELYHELGYEDYFDEHPSGWKGLNKKPDRALVFATGATKYPCFTFVPNEYIYANTVCVVASDSFALFASLTSDLHGVWAFEHGSRLHERLRYTHGDIFETFPFPEGVLTGEAIELAKLGEEFFAARREYMLAHDKGMTKFYNDFHDPKCNDDSIVACRSLQEKINETILAAYEINDIDLNMDFHEVGYLPDGKNNRFTMSETARQQILSRLAQFNKERHEIEAKTKNAGKHGRSSKASNDASGDLFAVQGGKN